jgi:NAD(P)-dependent dehydrogenase (short-subunit alcohol dehydrogenase family)
MSASAKTILVTGASRGLGRNTAINLAKGGFDVIITYQSQREAAAAVVKEIESLGRASGALKLDTSNIASFDAFLVALRGELSRLGGERLYGLVNNAGIGLDAAFEQTSEELFDRLINIHFKGVFFLTQKVLPLIVDGGRIVNISSGLARVALPGYSVYGSAKAAIETLTRFLAKELGGRKINVNVVAPGGLETDFGGGALRDIPEVKTFISAQTALGRTGLPQDVGPVIAALFADSHLWVTGQKIDVSGGWFL